MAEKSKTSRRDLLLTGGALAAVAAGWQVWINRTVMPPIVPIEGLPGWRMVEFEGLSRVGGNAANAVFLGIDDAPAVTPLSPDRLCPVVFSKAGNEVVPLAMFTDAFCPFCRVMDARLHGRSESVTWLDLPLLGPASVLAAKAALAADRQGPSSFRARMMAAPFRPTRSAITRLAEEVGLNGPRVVQDMDDPQITTHLATVRAAAATLGVFATPTLLVGQIVAMGNVENEVIDRLIDDEKTQPGPAC